MDMWSVQRAIEKISYKPGWRFIYYPGARYDDPASLLIEATVPTSAGTGDRITVGIRRMIPDFDFLTITDWQRVLYMHVQKWIGEMEAHEMNEWYKIDGAHFTEPHPQ